MNADGGSKMPEVYLDSCIVIYLHEGVSDLRRLIRDMILPDSGEPPVVFVSELTRLECRVQPIKSANKSLLDEYNNFFSLPEISRIPLSTEVIDIATELRAHHGIKTPDALHAAAAISAGCSEFWTNDRRLEILGDRISVRVIPESL